MEATLRRAARHALMRVWRAEREIKRLIDAGMRPEVEVERLYQSVRAELARLDAEDAIRALGEPVRWGRWEHRIGPAGELVGYRVDRGRIVPPGMHDAA